LSIYAPATYGLSIGSELSKEKTTKTKSEKSERTRTKINEELIMKWVKRADDGASYLKIAQEFSCNAATVAKHVKAVRDAGPKKRYQDALLSIESENLRTHNRSMLMTAEAIAQSVMVDPKLVLQDDSQALLNHYVEQQLLANNDWLVQRGTHFRSESEGFDSSWVPDRSITFDAAREQPTHRRLSQLLLRALYEHEPNLKTKVDLWAEKWDDYKKKLREKDARDAAAKTRGAHFDVKATEKTDAAHSVVKKTAISIRDLVDKMTLYGRPSGDCFLCQASGS
jgi:hypothetical protein